MPDRVFQHLSLNGAFANLALNNLIGSLARPKAGHLNLWPILSVSMLSRMLQFSRAGANQKCHVGISAFGNFGFHNWGIVAASRVAVTMQLRPYIKGMIPVALG